MYHLSCERYAQNRNPNISRTSNEKENSIFSLLLRVL